MYRSYLQFKGKFVVPLRVGLVLVVLFASGCHTHLALRKHTIQSVSTLADLHCQQVLDNVARFSMSPETLPSIALVSNGNVSVTDQTTLAGAATYAPTLISADQIGGFPILSLFFNPNAARGITENWTLDPVTDHQQISRLRIVFRYLVCGEVPEVQHDEQGQPTFGDGLHWSEAEFDERVPRGWYCVGVKKDVPRDAVYVSAYCGRYVWVTPSGIAGLSNVTLTVFSLASSDIKPLTHTVVRRYNRNDDLQETEITSTEEDPLFLESTPSESQDSQNAPSLRRLPKLHHSTPLSPKQLRRKPGTSPSFTPKL